jgi:hypothetical protein
MSGPLAATIFKAQGHMELGMTDDLPPEDQVFIPVLVPRVNIMITVKDG